MDLERFVQQQQQQTTANNKQQTTTNNNKQQQTNNKQQTTNNNKQTTTNNNNNNCKTNSLFGVEQIAHTLEVDLNVRDLHGELDVLVGLVNAFEDAVDAARDDTLFDGVLHGWTLHRVGFTRSSLAIGEDCAVVTGRSGLQQCNKGERETDRETGTSSSAEQNTARNTSQNHKKVSSLNQDWMRGVETKKKVGETMNGVDKKCVFVLTRSNWWLFYWRGICSILPPNSRQRKK